MKTSERLRKSLDHLWDGKSRFSQRQMFICLAVEKTDKKGFRNNHVNKIANYINSLLTPPENYKGPYRSLTVEGFLLREGYITTPYSQTKKIQAYRKAWVEHLIKEFEAKGD
jgi:hypothetical protein